MKKKWFRIMIIVLTLFFGYKVVASGLNGFDISSSFFKIGNNEASTKHGWNLILVNKDNYVPKNYEVSLLQLSNAQQIDERIYPDLQDMFDDMRKQGVDPEVSWGYRTHETQRQLFDEGIKEREASGYSYAEAKRLAATAIAIPGTSEHELGLAIDVADKGLAYATQPTYDWLASNSYKYGFILRYPENKTNITGIKYEPWHFRYVGKDHAKKMFDEKLVLEEYIETLN